MGHEKSSVVGVLLTVDLTTKETIRPTGETKTWKRISLSIWIQRHAEFACIHGDQGEGVTVTTIMNNLAANV